MTTLTEIGCTLTEVRLKGRGMEVYDENNIILSCTDEI